MDDLITDFIEVNFTPDLGFELLRSIQIFDYFNYNSVFAKLNGLLMQAHLKDTNEVRDTIVLDIRDGQDYIFRAHNLTISNDVDITNRNELLIGLALLMKLEDYEPILTVLYSDAEDMEKFTSIIKDICMLDEIQLYSMIEDFNPDILDTIKKFAEGRTAEEEVSELGRYRSTCVQSVKDFAEVFGKDNLGMMMMKGGALPGAPFRSYIPFIKDILIDKDSLEKTAKNFLSVLLLSSNGNNAPIITYKKYVDGFINSIETIQKLEPIIMGQFTELENFRRAKHDQRRVS